MTTPGSKPPFRLTHDWTPPAHQLIEVAALSLWLDGQYDDARAVMSCFTGIGAAEFMGKLAGFRGAVEDLYDAKPTELTGDDR